MHITAHSDAGERRTETLSFEEGEEVKFFTSDDLENGNVQKGIVTGIGAGEGDWRLELTGDLAFVAPVYLRTKRDGFLTSLHDTAPGPILVMSLMESPTGHLTNLSTTPFSHDQGLLLYLFTNNSG